MCRVGGRGGRCGKEGRTYWSYVCGTDDASMVAVGPPPALSSPLPSVSDTVTQEASVIIVFIY